MTDRLTFPQLLFIGPLSLLAVVIYLLACLGRILYEHIG